MDKKAWKNKVKGQDQKRTSKKDQKRRSSHRGGKSRAAKIIEKLD